MLLRKALLTVGALMLVCLLLFAAVIGYSTLQKVRGPSQQDIKFAQQQGDLIVAAIASCQLDHSMLPADLGELSPQYLTEIPSPTGSSEFWVYVIRGNGERYSLIHDWGGWRPQMYTSGDGWVVDTK